MPVDDREVNVKTGSKRSLIESVMTVGSITLLSRVLGLIRDIVIARLLGAGAGADAFFVAFRIPNFLRRLFAEGAFSQAFIPVLSEVKTQRDLAAVRDLIAHTAGVLGAVLLVVTIAGIVLAPFVIGVFAPGFHSGDGTKLALATDMLRITFPYLLFISLAALAGGVLNTYERFGVPAFTPVLLNLAMIGAAILLAPHLETPATALAWGVVLGGLAQLAFQLPFLARMKLLVWPRLRRSHSGVSRVLRLMLPAVFGASVSQINLLVNTLLASFLVTGSVSWLYFSDRLLEFPLGVFGVALGTVILPRLSSLHASADRVSFQTTLDWALRIGVLIAVPAAVALLVLAGPLLTTLFQYGAFRPLDVRMASLSLQAYSFGLLGFVLIKILAPAFFAQQDTRTPVKAGVIAVVANIIFCLALVSAFKHAGLALAISLAGLVNAGILYRELRQRGIYTPLGGWITFLIQVVSAAALMGAGLVWASGPLASWFDYSLMMRVAHLAALVLGGACAYGLTLLLFGVRPRHFKAPSRAAG